MYSTRSVTGFPELMKLGLSTIMHRDRPLDRHLMEMLQQAGVESVELTDYHHPHIRCVQIFH